MSLFSKLNQIKDLKQQAKTLQNQLSQETVEVEKNGVRLVMDGNQKIVELKINDDLMIVDRKSQLESTVKDLQNDAIGKVQKVMAEKMRSMDNFNIPGLTN